MQYITRQLKLGNTAQLRKLSLECGTTYSLIVTTFWRVYRNKNHWLSSNAMQKIIKNNNLHSQTVQGIIQSFYEALKSWSSLREGNQNARPPRKHRRFYAIPFKSSAIKLNNNVLMLSTGRGNDPIMVPWKNDTPKFCEISFKGGQYVLNAVYPVTVSSKSTGDKYAGLLVGKTHIGAVSFGADTHIANGRELRSKYLYRDKTYSSFKSKLDKCTIGSRKWKRLDEARWRTITRLNNQIKDILHKQTTALVCAMKSKGVQTVGIGNMQNIKLDNGCVEDLRPGRHHIPVSKIKELFAYKAELAGIEVVHQKSQLRHACPVCVEHNETSTLNYSCSSCGFQSHRYSVGAVNISHFTKYREHVPVVGDMTPPVGIRYNANRLRKSATAVA